MTAAAGAERDERSRARNSPIHSVPQANRRIPGQPPPEMMVQISRGRKTRMYMKINFRSSIGPSTMKASLAAGRRVVKLAATKASASLHRVTTTAKTIMMTMDRTGWPADQLPMSSLVTNRRTARGHQGAQQQEGRDVDEIVQGGLGNAAQTLKERLAAARPVSPRPRRPAGRWASAGCCHSGGAAIRQRWRRRWPPGSPDPRGDRSSTSRSSGRPDAGRQASLRPPEKATKVAEMTTTLMMGPASR